MNEKTYLDYVSEQAADMVVELKAHEQEKGGPGGWLDGNPDRWFAEAMGQIGELGIALAASNPLEIRRRAAHVCNFVMMASQAAREKQPGD
jgi:hypothetical protein